MYRTAQRSVGEHVWLGFSVAFNILGISGVAEDALKWKSFLLSFLHYYRRYFTDVIYAVFQAIWPNFLFPLPYFTADVFVLMAGFFAAANFYTIQTEGTSVVERLKATHCYRGGTVRRNVCLITSVLVLYILGPFIYLKAFVTRPTGIHRELGFVFCPAQVMRYYLILVTAAVCLIFVLSQFGI